MENVRFYKESLRKVRELSAEEKEMLHFDEIDRVKVVADDRGRKQFKLVLKNGDVTRRYADFDDPHFVGDVFQPKRLRVLEKTLADGRVCESLTTLKE